MTDDRDRIPLWWLIVMAAMIGAVVWSFVWTIVLMLGATT